MKSQSGFLKFIIRSGFLAEGAVYIAVGLLALQVAVGFGGETGDTKGALELRSLILRQPKFSVENQNEEAEQQ